MPGGKSKRARDMPFSSGSEWIDEDDLAARGSREELERGRSPTRYLRRYAEKVNEQKARM